MPTGLRLACRHEPRRLIPIEAAPLVGRLSDAAALAGTPGRLAAAPTEVRLLSGDPGWHVYSGKTGDLRQAFGFLDGGGRPVELHFTGYSRDAREASWIALAELAERYAATVCAGRPAITATADDLGDAAIDLDRIPNPSRAEIEAGCPLALPDKAAPRRWIRGVDLVRGREVWVPLALVAVCPPEDQTAAELIAVGISTGCAVHTDLDAALVAGMLEVIERDAVAVVWLQMLGLAPLDRSALSAQAERTITCNERLSIETLLFDATTDLGVPIVYVLELAPHARRGAQMVGCGAAPTAREAAERALRELQFMRAVLESYAARGENDPADDIWHVADGAFLMGAPSRRPAFEFLIDSHASRPVSRPQDLASQNAAMTLDDLLSRFADRGMSVIAVDLSCDELASVGFSAIKVVIPELQPMSLVPSVQYRGHRRLYQLPDALGYPVRPENALNTLPQPFA